MPVIKINCSSNLMLANVKEEIIKDIFKILPENINAKVDGIKVFFIEYNPDSICSFDPDCKRDEFVLIEVFMWEGRTKEQKSILVKELTGIVSCRMDVQRECVWTIINNINRREWAKSGLLCDS